MQSVGQKTMYDLRKEIFEHLQRLPMSFFDRSPVGRLVTRSPPTWTRSTIFLPRAWSRC